jgi:hypothetical protein
MFLFSELARIKQEREAEAARKAVEDKAREEVEKKEAMLRGNPLLASSSFSVKRRWDDDHVFRNQVRAASRMAGSLHRPAYTQDLSLRLQSSFKLVLSRPQRSNGHSSPTRAQI